VEKHLVRALALADGQFERLAGLVIANGDRHVTVSGVPEQADVNAVADATIELTRARRHRVVE
jgi:hypothetical protein